MEENTDWNKCLVDKISRPSYLICKSLFYSRLFCCHEGFKLLFTSILLNAIWNERMCVWCDLGLFTHLVIVSMAAKVFIVFWIWMDENDEYAWMFLPVFLIAQLRLRCQNYSLNSLQLLTGKFSFPTRPVSHSGLSQSLLSTLNENRIIIKSHWLMKGWPSTGLQPDLLAR